MQNPNNNNNMNRLFQNASQNQTQQGTGYTNLNRIFQANQNNKLGQKVVGDVSNQLGNFQNQLQQQKTKFQQESESNRLDTDQNKQQRDAVIGRFSDASGAGGQLTDEDVNKFEQFRAGQYKGPTSLGDTSGIQQTASGIAQQASNFNPSGTKDLLRRSVGANRYTQGQSKLDTLLFDRNALKPIQRQSQALIQDVGRASTGAEGQAQALANQAQLFGKETQEGLTSGINNFNTNIQQQLQTAQQKEADRVARIQAVQDFTSGKARTGTNQYEQLDNLKNLLTQKGASQEEITQLFGAGNFATAKNQYDYDLDKAKTNQLVRLAEMGQSRSTVDQILSNKNLANKLGYNLPASAYAQLNKGSIGNDKTYRAARADLLNRLKTEDLTYNKLQNTFNGTELLDVGQYDPGLTGNWVEPYREQLNASDVNFYGNRGVAAEALKANSSETFFKSLGRTLANSDSATGITEQGVASDPIRTNYTALQRLLGQGNDQLKFRDTDERYTEGKFVIDPKKIRETF